MTSALKQLKKSCPKHSENGDISSQQNVRITFIQQQKPSKLVYERIIQGEATKPKMNQENGLKTAPSHKMNQLNGKTFIEPPSNTLSAQNSFISILNLCTGG